LICKFTWSHCAQIPIFEKGYEKDPAVVAKEAIQDASRNKSDVVLVDTAGRMQVGLCSYYILCLCQNLDFKLRTYLVHLFDSVRTMSH
jgi:hypothetical protein